MRTSNQVLRLLRHPLRMTLPVVMRKLRLLRAVEVKLPGGGIFAGVLPEAVSTSVWRSGYHESDVTRVITEILEPGDSYVDVGAHFGYFVVVAANVVGPQGRVLAIEAMPETYAHLLRNTAGLQAHTEVFQCAAFEADTELTFSDAGIVSSSLNSAYSRREENLTTDRETSVVVQARTLDSLVDLVNPATIDLIKIDAESSELSVLKGAITTLQRFRPDLLIEIGDPGPPASGTESASRQILRQLADLGYHWRDISEHESELGGSWIRYANIHCWHTDRGT